MHAAVGGRETHTIFFCLIWFLGLGAHRYLQVSVRHLSGWAALQLQRSAGRHVFGLPLA